MVMVDESTVGKKNLPPRKLLNLGWLAGWLGWLAFFGFGFFCLFKKDLVS